MTEAGPFPPQRLRFGPDPFGTSGLAGRVLWCLRFMAVCAVVAAEWNRRASAARLLDESAVGYDYRELSAQYGGTLEVEFRMGLAFVALFAVLGFASAVLRHPGGAIVDGLLVVASVLWAGRSFWVLSLGFT